MPKPRSKSIFPAGGTQEGRTVMPSREEIKTGAYEGHVVLPFPAAEKAPLLHEAVKRYDKYLGWIAPFNGPKRAPAPPKPKGGFESGLSYDTDGMLDYKTGYEKAKKTARHLGYNVIEKDGNVLHYEFGNRMGYERGKNIYVASDISYEDKTEVLVHELLAKLMSHSTGMDHDSTHKFVTPVQKPLAYALAA